MQEGHIHAVANLLRAPVVVVDVRFAFMAGLFKFAPGYEPQKLIGKRRAAELRLDPQVIWVNLGIDHFSALVPGV